MKNVGINVPTAVWLNGALEKVRCCFGCNTWFLLNQAQPRLCGWSVRLPVQILSCYVSQTQMPKTNDTICFQPSGVIEFFPLSPAFQNPHVGQAWITCIRPCYLHRSSAVNWSLRLSDVLNLCLMLAVVAYTLTTLLSCGPHGCRHLNKTGLSTL